MAKFRVYWDFTTSQPTWKHNLLRIFGDYNTGVEVDAENEVEARKLVGKQGNLNPALLTTDAKRAKGL